MSAVPGVKVHPMQHARSRSACLPEVVALRSYEVYCHLYGKQEAMVKDGCRGGFSVGEHIAFLYAATFPRAEWRARVDEAFRGMVEQ